MRYEVRVWRVEGSERGLLSAWSGTDEGAGDAYAIRYIEGLQREGWIASCEHEGVVTVRSPEGDTREIETERMAF